MPSVPPPPADPTAPTAERDPRFPSGGWSGFFQQRSDRPTEQDMHFRGGRVSGAGADDVGPFTLSGRYDLARGTAEWTKSYAGWDVTYRGFAEDDSLWGTWALDSGRDGGGFRLWPDKRRRRDASASVRRGRPAVVSGDVDAADRFADLLHDLTRYDDAPAETAPAEPAPAGAA